MKGVERRREIRLYAKKLIFDRGSIPIEELIDHVAYRFELSLVSAYHEIRPLRADPMIYVRSMDAKEIFCARMPSTEPEPKAEPKDSADQSSEEDLTDEEKEILNATFTKEP